MDTRIDLELLDRYLASACTVRERADVERWLAADPRRSVIALKTHAANAYPATMSDPGMVWKRVYRRIHLEPQTPRSARQSLRDVVWPALAAIVLTAAVAVTSAGMRRGRTLARGGQRPRRPILQEMGGRANITLPDGSTVALDVASRLEVPPDSATGPRTGRRTGEGIFTVTHHSGTPFTVIAGSVTARVLGTSFVVRHYAADSLTTVAVRDGKVAVRSVVLTAERQVTIDRVRIGYVQPMKPAQFSFAAGVLTLDGVPFPAAIAELDRWYDADIRLGDPALAARRKSLLSEKMGSLADLSDILAQMFDVRVVRNGRVLTLYPR